MWIKSDEGKLINLDRVDTIEINPLNSIICKIGDKGICLGSYKSEAQAKATLNDLQEVLKGI